MKKYIVDMSPDFAKQLKESGMNVRLLERTNKEKYLRALDKLIADLESEGIDAIDAVRKQVKAREEKKRINEHRHRRQKSA